MADAPSQFPRMGLRTIIRIVDIPDLETYLTTLSGHQHTQTFKSYLHQFSHSYSATGHIADCMTVHVYWREDPRFISYPFDIPTQISVLVVFTKPSLEVEVGALELKWAQGSSSLEISMSKSHRESIIKPEVDAQHFDSTRFHSPSSLTSNYNRIDFRIS